MSAEAVKEIVSKSRRVLPVDTRVHAPISGDGSPNPPDEADAPPRRFKLLSVADVRAMPPMRWRVHSVLPEQGFAALYGPSGSGKGFLVVGMAAAIAEGADCFGHRTVQGRLIYVCLEGQAGVPQRIKAWEENAGRPFPDGVQFVFESFRLTSRDDVLGLAATIDAAGGADVIVIDTLNRAAPDADENSAPDMGRVLEAVKALQQMVGGLVLLVHHAGKDAARGMRGHSSVYAALDAVLEVTRTDDRREWAVHKAKDGRDGEVHPFRLRVVHLGEDDEGEAITSCAVESSQLEQAPLQPRVNLPTGGNQKIVYDALCPLFRESTTRGQAGAPPMRPCLSLDGAIHGVRDRLTVEPKRRTERAQQAINGLVARGVLGCNEGWIWLV